MNLIFLKNNNNWGLIEFSNLIPNLISTNQNHDFFKSIFENQNQQSKNLSNKKVTEKIRQINKIELHFQISIESENIPSI